MSEAKCQEQTVMVLDEDGRTRLKIVNRDINGKVKSRLRRRTSKALSLAVFGASKRQG